MCKRCQLPMYKYDQRKYFNWHAGIRATDNYHKVAQRYFEKIQEQEGKTRQIAEEGFELAEDTRKNVAQILHCNPRNVFFANSATCAAIPILLGVLANANFKAENMFFFDSNTHYPLISDCIFSKDYRDTALAMLTRQNYGERNRGLLRTPSFEVLNDIFISMKCSVESNPGLSNAARPKPFWIYEKAIENVLTKQHDERDMERVSTAPVFFLEHMDRVIGKVFNNQAINGIRAIGSEFRVAPSFLLLDGSHTFGIMDYDVTEICDAYIASSSKGLAAEPTIGIGYASDRILAMMESALVRSAYPRIAFQFGPETKLGVKESEVVSSKYWISLPELASLNDAIMGRLMCLGASDRLELKEILVKRLLDSALTHNFVHTTVGTEFISDVTAPLMYSVGSYGPKGSVNVKDFNLCHKRIDKDPNMRTADSSEFFMDSPFYLTFDPILERDMLPKFMENLKNQGFFLSQFDSKLISNSLFPIHSHLYGLIRLSINRWQNVSDVNALLQHMDELKKKLWLEWVTAKSSSKHS